MDERNARHACPPISLLPPVLLSQVFAFLADSGCISKCRLVSPDFHRLSSPYLITTAVIAERLDTLQKYRELLDHPYFSQHVTHLILDASYYESGLACNFTLYEQRSSQMPRRWENTEYAERVHADLAALSSLSEHDPKLSNMYGPVTSIAPTADRSNSPIADTIPRGAYPANASMQAENGWGPILPDRTLYSINQNGEFVDGCIHQGFADYHRRYQQQQAIAERYLAPRYLYAAFTGFPKLQSVCYSDYRALARNGESYNDLTCRLFGVTVYPCQALLSHPYEDGLYDDDERDERDEGHEDGLERYVGIPAFLGVLGLLNISRKWWIWLAHIRG